MTTLSQPQPHRQAPLFALWHWAKKNLFSSIPNSLLTLLCFWLLWHILPPLLNWTLLQANWVGETRADCTRDGACWVFIQARFGHFMYGLYPAEESWRINFALVLGLLSILPMFWRRMPRRGRYIAIWAVCYPLLAWWLLYGGFGGLTRVETRQWGWADTYPDHRGDWYRRRIGVRKTFNHASGAYPVRGVYRILAQRAADHRVVYVLGDAAAVSHRRHQHR